MELTIELANACYESPRAEQYTPEQLGVIRRQAEELLEAGAERALDLPGRESEQVWLSVDWESPSLHQTDIITFKVRVARAERISSIRFEVDLGKLQTNELEKMLGVLSARHAGTDDAVSITRSVAWLLELSIAQAQPNLPSAERQLKVRRLLLSCEDS